MHELTAFQSFWILAANTLLHELGLPLPVMPTAFVLGARGLHGGPSRTDAHQGRI
jgi:hypothetical protein